MHKIAVEGIGTEERLPLVARARGEKNVGNPSLVPTGIKTVDRY
jgi:hypothetical protein